MCCLGFTFCSITISYSAGGDDSDEDCGDDSSENDDE